MTFWRQYVTMFLPLEVAEDILFFHSDQKSYGITLVFIQNSKEEPAPQSRFEKAKEGRIKVVFEAYEPCHFNVPWNALLLILIHNK